LRDRHELSFKNNWVDEDGNVYLIFSREDMSEMACVSDSTILRCMRTLKAFNLIEEERQGLGKLNKIYVLTVENVENTQRRQIDGSRDVKKTDQEASNRRPDQTDLNKTDTKTHKQQTPRPIHTEQEQQPPKTEVVVVSEPPKKSSCKTKPAPDVSCLSFIAELPDADKLSILKATGNDIPNIQQAYDLAKQQGGIDNLTAWIIAMVGKLQNGEVSPPVGVKRQTMNRFVNFQQRNIDYKELERLELEQLKKVIRKDGNEEEFVN